VTARAVPSPTKKSPPPAPKPKPPTVVTPPAPKPPAVQQVSIAVGAAGYEPSTVSVHSGAPIRITVAQGQGCAAGFLMPRLGISQDNSAGPITFEVGPLDRGTYTFTCGMGMLTGQLVVE
jgi:plastocyanin domain-containing protein